MYLLLVTTLLSLLTALTNHFSKPLLTWLKRPLKKERELRQQISELRREQAQISMVDNFATHAKIQRKINRIELQLQNISSERNTNSYMFQLGVTYGFKCIVGFFLLCVVIYYRYTPVYVFPNYINLFPLNNIISYPNEENNAVSVHFWLMVCNTVIRQCIK